MRILELGLTIAKQTVFFPLGMERLVLKSNILYTSFSLVSPYNCFPEPVQLNGELCRGML